MGGRRGRCLLLGLLLLISGSAEEETSGPPADSPVAPTIPLPLNSSEFPDFSVSGSADSTPEALGNDVTEQTPPPATPTDDTESNSTTASVTIDETSPDPGRTNSNDTTGADATPPPPTAPPTPVTPPSPTTLPPSTAHNMTADTSETPSILATLRATDETPLHDDSSPLTTTSTSIYSPGMSPITTTVTVPASSATTEISSTAAAPHTTRAEGQRGAAVLEVGDEKDLTGYHSRNGSNPLFVMIVSVFTIMVVMVVVVVGFHRYKKKNSRTEFRRLQDLPMDDMMEDTPLSLYSY